MCPPVNTWPIKADDQDITADDTLGGEWRPGEEEGQPGRGGERPLRLTCAGAAARQTHAAGREAVHVYLPGRKIEYISKLKSCN